MWLDETIELVALGIMARPLRIEYAGAVYHLRLEGTVGMKVSPMMLTGTLLGLSALVRIFLRRLQKWLVQFSLIEARIGEIELVDHAFVAHHVDVA